MRAPRRFPGKALWPLGLLTGAILSLAALAFFGAGQAPVNLTTHAHAADEAPSAPKTLYTCGMHPEVIQDHPGDCPKCAMKLVPMERDRAQMILEARGEAPAGGGGADGVKKDRKILYWRAPMDPAYIRDEPGKSPMGMDLVPVYEDDVAGGPTIRIDPVTEQNMGVRFEAVRLGSLEKTVRTAGSVEYDERGLSVVTTKTDGWVERVYVSETGTQVNAGDALFEFYSPQLFSAQEEYLVASHDVRRATGETARELAQERRQSARQRLSLYDISDGQIDQLEATGQISKTLVIAAARPGIVTHRGIAEGEYLKAGQPAYRTADLSTVWVIGKVYESDLPYVKLGQEARMTLDYLPGQTYNGRVTYIYPYLEKGTREIPVRMEFANPDFQLKPGMYATIRFDSRLEDQAVLVSSMAVIDTGERQVAFVRSEPGKFVPRRLEIGLRSKDGQLQVLSGLAPGEMVVVSGQFLLDSESRLREATLKMLDAGLTDTRAQMRPDPADGDEATTPGIEMPPEMDGNAANGGQDTDLQLYTCPMAIHADVVSDHPGDCPKCGMTLTPTGEVDHGKQSEAFWHARHADGATTPVH